MKRTHAAMNINTGEVITSTSAKSLKKIIDKANRYDGKWFGTYKYYKTWIFAHGSDWQQKLYSKYMAHLNTLRI